MMLTNWGYTLTEVDEVPALITLEEFDEMTGDKYRGDVRANTEALSAQSAIRNYVGWHLVGNLACEVSLRAVDKAVSVIGNDVMIQLPARYVTAIDNIIIDGNEAADFYIQPSGILRVFDVVPASRKSEIIVDYHAGLPDEMAMSVKELAAHHVTHALANSYGVQSESSGGVSITYSAAWIQNARSTKLSESDKEVLEPYRLQGVF